MLVLGHQHNARGVLVQPVHREADSEAHLLAVPAKALPKLSVWLRRDWWEAIPAGLL